MSADFYTYEDTQRAQQKASPDFHAKPFYAYVQSDADLEAAIAPLLTAKILAIDTETTGRDPHTDRLRLLQLATPNQPVVIIDLFALKERRLLKHLLQGNALKVGHHFKFDWQFLTQAGMSPKGPFFDTQLAFKVWTAGIKVRSSLQAVVKKILEIDLDKDQQQSDFSQSNLTPKQLQYAATDAAILLPLHDALVQRLKVTRLEAIAHLESQCLVAFAQMELHGMGIDQHRWKEQQSALNIQLAQTLEQLHQQLRSPGAFQISLLPDCSDGINPNSPKQVKAALAAIGISVKSTDQRTLLPIADQHSAIRTLLQYRHLSKLSDSFYQPLLHHIHPVTGRVHPTWYQLGARSGRASCRDPALQTIPRNESIRRCFAAKPGNVIVKADFNQIELRIVAKISGDNRMQQAYRAGKDLHQLTAAFILGKPPEQVTEEERRLAKAINFGLIYGMGAVKLQNQAQVKYGITMSLEDARHFCKRFFELYPGIKKWHERVKRDVYIRKLRECRTMTGRRRRWREQPRLNEMINQPVQGLNADITKMVLVMLTGKLPFESHIIGMLHDEVLVECPEGMAAKVRRLVHRCMEQVAQRLLEPIPVIVDVQVGKSWAA